MDQQLIQRFEYSNGTLKNKLHEFNQTKLAQIEYRRAAYVGARILNDSRLVINDFTDLQRIHYLLFSWLYEWAGQVRDYNLSKGDTTFLPVNFLQHGIDEINKQILVIKQIKIPTVQQYAILLDRLNFLHPFCEGNGRATKVFITKLALNKQQKLSYQRNSRCMIKALQDANIMAISKQLILENIKE